MQRSTARCSAAHNAARCNAADRGASECNTLHNATLPVALANLKNSGAGNIGTQGVIMGASLITSLPTIALYFATQKHFIRGIALSGLK
jgi:ABC-type glycerol-3-phosphate transport system permease component